MEDILQWLAANALPLLIGLVSGIIAVFARDLASGLRKHTRKSEAKWDDLPGEIGGDILDAIAKVFEGHKRDDKVAK